MIDKKSPRFIAGVAMLANPILPLVRIVQMLYITGPFERISEILEELNEPVEMAATTYANPKALLQSYLDDLRLFEQLKHPAQEEVLVLDETLAPLDTVETLELLVTQRILTRELEQINSLLCTPCACTLCCVGPTTTMEQLFFEIPLEEREAVLFDLPRIDTEESRKTGPYDEPPMVVAGADFFEGGAALYRWNTGWSLILPKETACPNLVTATGGCAIYPDRPETCRRPQIFPFALERLPDRDAEGKTAYAARRKLLAIWDCLYVRELQNEIGAYAQLCEITPIFKENKA